MQTQFTQAIEQICEEKNIDKAIVMEAVEAALAAAYKKDYGEKDQEVRVEIKEDTGAIEVFVTKEVVEEVENSNLEISISAASKIKKDIKIGDTIEIMDLPADFGRIAAQTAKQVIVQRIREAERDMVFSEYKDKEGELLNCIVQRVEGDTVICDLGKASAVLYRNEQIQGERYYPNQRFRVFLVRVEQTARGPQIIVSRSHPGMVKKLFESEVPEIAAGTVEIMGISREAGGRTKIAVRSTEDGIDPVGSFVGQRGIRVQSVMNEIGSEKIDIILYNEDPKVYIENALSPAKIAKINLDEKEQKAQVKVPEDQLSLAIGKQGQNVRLAAKLTGWNIDIEGTDSVVEEVESVAKIVKRPEQKQDLEAAIINAVKEQNVGGEEDSSKEERQKTEDNVTDQEVVEDKSAPSPNSSDDQKEETSDKDEKETVKEELDSK
ncbi:MAG: transcription termination factor NusA [Patescibacteria group bacterium]|nr:transcription termination factor NusA [Patescibacteria group bacterium]